MKIASAVAVGFVAFATAGIAVAGALYGLDVTSVDPRPAPLPTTKPPLTISPGEAAGRLFRLAQPQGRSSSSRAEFLQLLEHAGTVCSKEDLLALAAGSRRVEVMEWLLAAGALPGGGKRPAAPLLAAVSAGDVASVRLLLRAGAAADPIRSGVGFQLHPTPLVAAICSGSLDCADVLLEAGADPRRPIDVPGITLNAIRKPGVLRLRPAEARRLRRMTALELARLSPNPAMVLVVGRKRAPQRSAGLVVATKR